MEKRKLRTNVQKALDELRNNPELQPIVDPPLRPVKNIQFGILSPDEIRAISVCEVKESRITHPSNDTVYDERMGPYSSHKICTTCNEELRVCPGHFGHIELAVPIIHPMFIKFIVAILNCICLKCFKLKLSREEIDLEIIIENERYIRYVDKLNTIIKKCSHVAFCPECNYPYPQIKEENRQIYKIYDTKKDAKKSAMEIEEIRAILMKISNEDLEIMGFQPQKRKVLKMGKIEEDLVTFRPEWLILECLPVIPPMSRPPDHDGDNRSDDDLTTSYADIIKFNDRLKASIREKKEKTYFETLFHIQKQIKGLFDNSDGAITRSSGKVSKGIKERISGKNGHIRGKIMGKRVDCSARTVITADPNLRLNEVGVPEEIARTLSFPEKIAPRNLEQLKELLREKKINKIVQKKSGKTIKVAFSQKELNLNYGDIAFRQLRDRDTIVFNRQPTLHRGSMMAHYARVLPGKTFRLNLSVTTPYNADFDGDEMQAHAPQDYGTVNEVQTLMGVNKMIVSPQASRPIMGVVQDGLAGVFLLTQPGVTIAKHHFMDCVFSAGEEYVDKMRDLFQRARKFYAEKDLYCGRVLFSVLLPENFEFQLRNDISKSEPVVIVKSGIHISGVVDKKIVGRSHGSIIHRLYKECGPDRSAEFLSSVQFLVNRWLSYRGFSVGMADFLISQENEKGIQVAIQKAYIEVQTIQESSDPEILKEFRINNALNNRGQSLAINGLCKDNRLEVMINSGSKGSRMNIIQITGHLGQNNVEGKRIQFEIDNGRRTLSCFNREDIHPRTRGFIESCFLKGLTPSEFWFHAKAGREGIISTAVRTKEVGYQSRKLVKRMEDLTAQLDYTIRTSTNSIICFSYGDNLNPVLAYESSGGPSFCDIDNIVNSLNSQN